MDNTFTLRDTCFSKGVALCLMIVHHLFYDVPNIGYEINGVALSQTIAILGKVCVSIFLILSGYGLNKSYKTSTPKIEFIKKHLFKIYFNYWLIILLSIIIGLVFFPIELMKTLPNHAVIRVILAMSGLHFLVNNMGFNITWWFITITIVLYCLFPLIKFFIDKYNYKFLLFSITLLFSSELPIDVFNMKIILKWFFPFILGVYISNNNFLDKLYKIRRNPTLIFTISILFISVLIIRNNLGMSINGYRLDPLFGLLIIIINFLYVSRIKLIDNLMSIIGKHSMNMYLIHYFITTIYTRNFIYGIKEPIIMFLVTLILSLLFSVAFEYFKALLKGSYHSVNKMVLDNKLP